MSITEKVIEVKNLSKTFEYREISNDTIRQKVRSIFAKDKHSKKIEALKNLNFSVNKGDFFGIIGKNGSGKSTLLKIIIGAFKADKGGYVRTSGKMNRLALGLGLDLSLTARDNIYVTGSILGLTFKEIGKRFNEIISFAELDSFVDTPIKFYSSGMKSRLSFAIAMHVNADILLIDEFFGGVGDLGFREKSDNVFKEAFIKGRTIVYISHDIEEMKAYCNKIMLLNEGEQVAIGTPEEIIPIYQKLFN